MIKVDTEGYDKEILESTSDLITHYKLSIITESFGGNTPEQKMELYEVLEQLNYDIHYFGDFIEDASIIKDNSTHEMPR